MDISVIIVSYNVKEFLQQALFSLQKSLQGVDSEIIIVDNASIDGSKKIIKNDFPEIQLIENQENVGFAKPFFPGSVMHFNLKSIAYKFDSAEINFF